MPKEERIICLNKLQKDYAVRKRASIRIAIQKNGGKYDAVKGRQMQITQQPQKHKKAHAVRRSFIVGLYIRTSKRVRREGCQQEREETNEN